MASPSDAAKDGKHPVPRAPAPWTTKSECYWMFLTLKGLPAGVYDSLEAGSLGTDAGGNVGEFKGGLGAVIVVRYEDTVVGPYDELMLIPGNFSIPQPADGPPKIPKKALRVARIYVSQRTTTYNGRLNWNIPKHLARFHFSAPPTPAGDSPPESLTIKVFPAGSKDGDGAHPFFACTLKPWKWVPSMPVSSKWLPISTTHVQPPLPQAPGFKQAVDAEVSRKERIDEYDVSPKFEESVLVGTDRWYCFPVLSYTPRGRGCWVKVHDAADEAEGSSEEARKEAGKHWPQDIQPWSIGAWMEDAQMDILAPLEWKL